MSQSVAFIGLGAMGYRMAAIYQSISEKFMSGIETLVRLNNMQQNMEPRRLNWLRQYRQMLSFMPANQCRC